MPVPRQKGGKQCFCNSTRPTSILYHSHDWQITSTNRPLWLFRHHYQSKSRDMIGFLLLLCEATLGFPHLFFYSFIKSILFYPHVTAHIQSLCTRGNLRVKKDILNFCFVKTEICTYFFYLSHVEMSYLHFYFPHFH